MDSHLHMYPDSDPAPRMDLYLYPDLPLAPGGPLLVKDQ